MDPAFGFVLNNKIAFRVSCFLSEDGIAQKVKNGVNCNRSIKYLRSLASTLEICPFMGKEKGGSAMAKRTTHRSKSGTKLYAVRDSKGRFKDIQTYKRAHGQDIKRKSKKEK